MAEGDETGFDSVRVVVEAAKPASPLAGVASAIMEEEMQKARRGAGARPGRRPAVPGAPIGAATDTQPAGGRGRRRGRAAAEAGETAEAEASGPPAGTASGPPPAASGGGGRDDYSIDLHIPSGCPVMPLGLIGDTYFLLDVNDQLRPVKAKEFSKNTITSLFGREVNWLMNHAPYDWLDHGEKGEVKRWRPEIVSAAIMARCSEMGVWDVFGRVRGRGGWRGPAGELVLHLGDRLMISRPPLPADAVPDPGRPMPAGEIRQAPTGQQENMVYPTRPSLPLPAEEAQGTLPGGQVLDLLASWHWRRPIDPELLVGWVACAVLGGFLKWRPLMWITGDKGTGKSTLHDAIKIMLGDAILGVTDATAAGIWQRLGYDCLAVAFDELESDVDNKKGEKVIGFARTASSGGLVLRGGQDHQGSDFEARSCFLFSSINMLSLRPQDRSRMAILELLPIRPGTAPLTLDEGRLRAWGRALKRRLLDQAPRFDATLALFRQALLEAGHSSRGADQFGALLAAADLVLSDGLPEPQQVADKAQELAAATLAELADDTSNHDACLNHLAGWLDPADKSGQRRTIGRVIETAAGIPRHPEDIDLDMQVRADAQRLLETYGLKLVTTAADTWYVAVANSAPAIEAIFSGTVWQAAPGARGVWPDALKRIGGAVASNGVVNQTGTMRFAGVTAKAMLVPLSVFTGEACPRPIPAYQTGLGS